MRFVTRSAVGVVAAACVALPAASWAKSKATKIAGYTLAKVVVLGDPAPGGGNFVAGTDFEPGDINEKGQIAFVSEVPGGEGIFLFDGKRLQLVVRVGMDSPAGGKFGPTEYGRCDVNSRGDVAFAWLSETGGGAPLGLGGMAYRWSKGKLTPLVTLGNAAPGGGTFQGVHAKAGINDRGDVVFAALISGADIDPTTPPGDSGLGRGIFLADKKGRVTAVVRPGDPAPGGKVFDVVGNPSVNARGEIAFDAHVAGDACLGEYGQPPTQHTDIYCGGSIFVRRADGTFESIAHAGDPASGGALHIPFGAEINDVGDVVFCGRLEPAGSAPFVSGIYLNHAGYNAAIVRPGDLMPGGGHVTDTTNIVGGYDLNNRGDVAFDAVLDTDDDHDGNPDSGVYVRPAGSLAPLLVARTGTVVPDVGTIAHIQSGATIGASSSQASAVINNKGQVVFQSVMTDGRVVLFKATPHK